MGEQMVRHPERFSGNVKVHALEGGVTALTINISIRPQLENENNS